MRPEPRTPRADPKSIPESSVVVRPEPSSTQSSRLQAAGLARAIALFEKAAERVALPKPPQPIVVADYGAANGHTSLKPLAAAISVLRRRTRHDHAILVTHTDIPGNDFAALFQNLSDDPDSYLHLDAASFASAIGRSFYGQIVPSGTVNLGWTSWATQWLSRVPCELSDHVHVAHSNDDAARSAYADQAAMDWHNFVAFRGRELAPEGRMVVLTMAVDDDGNFGFTALLDAIVAGLADLVGDGLLSGDEVRRMILPSYALSEKDFRAPFAPSGRFEGLKIDHLELFDAEDRFWAQLQAGGETEAFGAQWAAFARAALFHTLLSGLTGGSHDPRAAHFVERLETAVAQRLSSTPQPMRIPLALVELVKREHARS